MALQNLLSISIQWGLTHKTSTDPNQNCVHVTAVIHFTKSSPFVSKSGIPSWTCVSGTSSWLHKRKGQSRVWQQWNSDITEGYLVHLDMTKRVAKITPICDELLSKDELSHHNSWWHDPTATHRRGSWTVHTVRVTSCQFKPSQSESVSLLCCQRKFVSSPGSRTDIKESSKKPDSGTE